MSKDKTFRQLLEFAKVGLNLQFNLYIDFVMRIFMTHATNEN